MNDFVYDCNGCEYFIQDPDVKQEAMGVCCVNPPTVAMIPVMMEPELSIAGVPSGPSLQHQAVTVRPAVRGGDHACRFFEKIDLEALAVLQDSLHGRDA